LRTELISNIFRRGWGTILLFHCIVSYHCMVVRSRGFQFSGWMLRVG